MEHNREVEIVNKALEFEKQVQKLDNEYAKTKREEYPSMRVAPVLEQMTYPYPEVTADLKFNKLWFLLLIWPIGGWIILYFVYRNFKENKEAQIEKIKNSETYKNKCHEIDLENYRLACFYQEKYEKEMSIYNQELTEYNRKKSEWQKEKEDRLSNINELRENAKLDREKFYLSTKLVPVKYQNIFCLEYIYNFIAYSEYSFKESVDNYERYMDRKMQEAQLKATHEVEEKLHSVIQGEYVIADVLSKFVDEYSGFAKKQLIANGVDIIQKHNSNKMLKERLKAFKSSH